MAETPEDEARRQRISAYVLLRAAVIMDRDAAVLLVAEAQRDGAPSPARVRRGPPGRPRHARVRGLPHSSRYPGVEAYAAC
jgi:hypothetical protein